MGPAGGHWHQGVRSRKGDPALTGAVSASIWREADATGWGGACKPLAGCWEGGNDGGGAVAQSLFKELVIFGIQKILSYH